jgi:acid phosphatase
MIAMNIKINRFLFHSLLVATAAFLFQSQSFAEPRNISLLKEQVQSYHDSGAYQKEFSAVIIQAHDFVVRRTKDNAKSVHPKKLAIVLDIDETSLSNYHHLVKRQFSGHPKQWHDDIHRADAPGLPPMLVFYTDVLNHGVHVFFVTGRRDNERFSTIKNLKTAGYHDWTGLYLRSQDDKQPSVVPFKVQARAAITKRGFTIIANIGDQESDLKGGYAERTFKLPNPYYYIR